MKFRTAIKDQQSMREFHNIIQTLSKLTKECVLNISSDKLLFIVNADSAQSSKLVWTELESSTFFIGYGMRGVSDQLPNILLSLNPINLARALAIAKNTPLLCEMKLTNKPIVCLAIKIEVLSSNVPGGKRAILHQVPVQLIPSSDWHVYRLPSIPDSKIVMALPSFRLFRTLIDKIRNLSPTISFCASSNGELNITAQTETSTISTTFTTLEISAVVPSQTHGDDAITESSCTIDCKKIAVFLSSLHCATLEKIYCGISQDNFIHMQVDMKHGIEINCIMPAVCV